MNTSEFATRIALLLDELYEANEYFLCYVHLRNKQATHLRELNVCPGFFQLTLESFLELSALRLAHLFDDDAASVSLFRICGWLEQSKALRIAANAAEVNPDDIRCILDDCKRTIAQLKTLRDKLLAHTDKKQLTLSIWEMAGISVHDYRQLITAAHEIICLCKLVLNEPTPMLGLRTENEIDMLIGIITEHLDRI